MVNSKTLEIYRVHLFDKKDEMINQKVPQMMIERILRIRSTYNYWLESPNKEDAEIRDYLVNSGINKSQAYEDIQIIKLLLGDLNKTSKDYHRFRFIQKIENAYKVAEAKEDPRAMASAAGLYAKYNQLDKEDALRIPWDEIVPQIFEPTSDPTVIGIKPVANIKEKIAAMKTKYMQDIAEDIEYETVDFNEDDLFNAPMNIDEK